MQTTARTILPEAELASSTGFAPHARVVREVQPALSRGLPLNIRGLRKSFGDNEVLRGIDLHIPAGQFVAIVGKSGCEEYAVALDRGTGAGHGREHWAWRSGKA